MKTKLLDLNKIQLYDTECAIIGFKDEISLDKLEKDIMLSYKGLSLSFFNNASWIFKELNTRNIKYFIKNNCIYYIVDPDFFVSLLTKISTIIKNKDTINPSDILPEESPP